MFIENQKGTVHLIADGQSLFSFLSGGSDVEAEVNHISVLHHVLLALAAELALLLSGADAAVLHHIVKGDDLRPDEAPLNIGMNFSASSEICFFSIIK